MLGACLVETKHHQEKSALFLSFLTFVSSVLSTGCQRVCGVRAAPGRRSLLARGSQTASKHQGGDGNGWATFKRSPAARAVSSVPLVRTAGASIPQEFIAQGVCCTSSVS